MDYKLECRRSLHYDGWSVYGSPDGCKFLVPCEVLRQRREGGLRKLTSIDELTGCYGAQGVRKQQLEAPLHNRSPSSLPRVEDEDGGYWLEHGWGGLWQLNQHWIVFQCWTWARLLQGAGGLQQHHTSQFRGTRAALGGDRPGLDDFPHCGELVGGCKSSGWYEVEGVGTAGRRRRSHFRTHAWLAQLAQFDRSLEVFLGGI